MKKKKLAAKLALRKKVISKLDSNALQGGTDTIVVTVVETIDLTIDIFTRISKQDPICPWTNFCETQGHYYCVSYPDCPTDRTC